jgi:hypothetical protein
MSKANWSDLVEIDAVTLSADAWLKMFKGQSLSTKAIVEQFNDAGYSVTGNAVNIKWHRMQAEVLEEEDESTTDADASNLGKVTLDVQSDEPQTPGSIMRTHGLDPADWIVKSFRVRSWNTLPAAVKDLTSIEGRWSGTVKREEGVKDLFSYSLSIAPKVIDDQELLIRPIRAAATVRVPDTVRETDAPARVLAGGDAQIGFYDRIPHHDRKALSLFVSIAQRWQPERIIVGGDWIDFAALSDRFFVRPEARGTVQATLCEAHYWLWALREVCPQARIDFLEGNHDQRLWKAGVSHLAEMIHIKPVTNLDGWPAMSIPNLLGLDSLNINYLKGWPGNEVWLRDDFRVTHGEFTSSTPGGTVKAVLKNAAVHTVVLHSHVSEIANKTQHTRFGTNLITGAVVGCLCKIDGSVPGRVSRPQWQQSVGAITYSEDLAVLPNINLIPISEGIAYCSGHRIEHNAKDHMTALLEMFPQLV